MNAIVGIDLGGTGIRAGLVEPDGRVSSIQTFRHGGFPQVRDAIDRVESVVNAVSGGRPIDAVGIGVAAWVERDTGFIARAPNLGWINVPFGELLSRRLGRPVVVHNDLKAIAWGEHRFGAGVGSHTSLTVFVGTGVGAAVIAEGILWTGARGFGGELGHIQVGPADGPPCGCGRRGCLESYVGGSALARRAGALRAQGRFTHVPPEDALPEITAADLEQAAQQGDGEARTLLEQGGDLLGRVLGGFVTFLNPDVVLFGGGVWTSSDIVQDSTRLGIELASHPDHRKSVRFVESALGAQAGILGAADLARHRV